jgi:hypothetical protein
LYVSQGASASCSGTSSCTCTHVIDSTTSDAGVYDVDVLAGYGRHAGILCPRRFVALRVVRRRGASDD